MSTVVLHDQQFLLNDPSGRAGDCLRAAVATMLQEPVDAVPHFAEAPDWICAVLEWRPGVLVLDYRHLARPITFPIEASTRPWVVGCGQSPRSVLHAVVLSAVDGTLVHDPHPSRDGLVGPVEFLIVAVW